MTVLVTSGEQRSALAVTRSLGKRGLKVIVGETHKKSLTFYSRYAQGSFVYPLTGSNRADFVRSVLDVARTNGVELIIPTTDPTLAALSERRTEVEAVAKLACPIYNSVCLAVNKKKTLTLARSLNIPIPETIFIENLDSTKEVIERLGLPIVIKPAMKKFFNDDEGHDFAVEYVTSLESLQERLMFHKKNGSYPILQEYCKGVGVGIEALMSEGEPLALFQHRRIREMPVSGGVSVLCESVPVDPVLKEYAVRLLKAMNWEGAAMVEFRVDEKTKTAELMEVNGRFWGSLALAIQAGVDFPYLVYELFVNSKKIRVDSYRTNLKCQYRRGDLERLIQIMRNKNSNPVETLPPKKRAICDFALSLFDPRIGDLVFSFNDVLPGLVDLKRLFAEVWKKLTSLKNGRQRTLCSLKNQRGKTSLPTFSSEKVSMISTQHTDRIADEAKEQFDYRETHKDFAHALNYEYDIYADDSYDSCLWEIGKSVIAKEIGLLRKTKIRHLDFGCGTGRILSFVEQYVSESTGIDVSENMLNLAKNKIKKSSVLNCDLTKDDIIKNNQYDLITAFRFFLNAQEDLRKKVMLLLSEKLIDNGIFIFDIHGHTRQYYLLPMMLKKDQEKLSHLSFFKLFEIIKNSKLKIKRMYGIGFIPFSLYKSFKSGKRFFMNIDIALSNCRFLKYFAKNLIFVCIKDTNSISSK